MGPHRSVDVWRSRVIEQQRSGESKAAYCSRHGISSSTFHRWCRRFADGDQLPSFVQVFQAAAPVPASSDAIAEIHLPFGPVVRCPVGSDVAWLRDLAMALASC